MLFVPGKRPVFITLMLGILPKSRLPRQAGGINPENSTNLLLGPQPVDIH